MQGFESDLSFAHRGIEHSPCQNYGMINHAIPGMYGPDLMPLSVSDPGLWEILSWCAICCNAVLRVPQREQNAYFGGVHVELNSQGSYVESDRIRIVPFVLCGPFEDLAIL
jgi:hypothetical protein